MLKRLLIANRGEIARRVIRTARRMGVETVAVYSDADRAAPHVREADAAVRIGPPPARESYLDIGRVIAAARESGADSVHPGYGFLSENADFAEAVEAAGLVWVGPPPAAIRAMGPKDEAKRIMEAAGVLTTPGWRGEDQSAANLRAQADAVGYPLLIKAVSGGGGKGMRRVDASGEFAAALASAQREGAASFGDPRVLLERYMARPRHIEVQVFADAHGNVVHLFERDCSLQRRHQKVIEEAPAPGMDAAAREAVCGAAVRAARAVGYRGAGTVEFIADASEGLRADRIFFMEMNTRLQVEHPVTEMITGLDLVEWQLRVAAGEPLPLAQGEIRMTGWAMEARLYAEDPATGFLPSTGRLEHVSLPGHLPGVRVDAGVEPGGEVTPYYDPMIAKVIVQAPTREQAARRLSEACGRIAIWPVRTNAAFLVRCASEPDFVDGRIDTGFIPDRIERLTAPAELSGEELGEFVSDMRDVGQKGREPCKQLLDSPSLTGFRLNAPAVASAAVWVNGEPRSAPLVQHASTSNRSGSPPWLIYEGGSVFEIALSPPSVGSGGGGGSDGKLVAPMPGRVVQLAAEMGAAVKKGELLVTLEAMKMEHGLAAPFDGVVAEVSAAVGDQVIEGAVLVRLEHAAEAEAAALRREVRRRTAALHRRADAAYLRSMALHMIKLVVGVETLDELLAWRAARAHAEHDWVVHTRMTPKRAAEIEDGGSIYRVIKGVVVCRQRVLDIATHGEGRAARCRITVASECVGVVPTARRPFQGWRYLEPKDAPPDLEGLGEAAQAAPPELVRQLRELGAW